MSDAPERFWLLWPDDMINGRYSVSSLDHSAEGDFPAYVRAARITALEAQIAAADRLADKVQTLIDGNCRLYHVAATLATYDATKEQRT